MRHVVCGLLVTALFVCAALAQFPDRIAIAIASISQTDRAHRALPAD